jgi:hypothetical protein
MVVLDETVKEKSEPDDLEASLQGDMASTDDLVDEFRDFIESINPEDFQP